MIVTLKITIAILISISPLTYGKQSMSVSAFNSDTNTKADSVYLLWMSKGGFTPEDVVHNIYSF
jgi:hypothetical protein